MAGWPLEEQSDAHMWAYMSPPRMRSSAVGGGGGGYWTLAWRGMVQLWCLYIFRNSRAGKNAVADFVIAESDFG